MQLDGELGNKQHWFRLQAGVGSFFGLDRGLGSSSSCDPNSN
jgi:hypothetical protein